MRHLKPAIFVMGAVGVLGGILWIAWVLITASRPLLPLEGYRDSEDIAVLQGISMLLMAVGIAGVFVRHREERSWLETIALAAGVVGAITGLAGTVVITRHGSNYAVVPFLYGGGSLLLIFGITLTGISIVRAGILPSWSGWLLIGGVALAMSSNENSSDVLVLAALGIAWIIVGSTLSLHSDPLKG